MAGAADRKTRRFYEELMDERTALLAHISGVPDDQRHRYATVLVGRMVLLAFLQHDGRLDGDHDYLRKKLEWSRQHLGPDQFFQGVLRPLWRIGLTRPPEARPPEVEHLLGKLPFLAEGLFVIQPAEKHSRLAVADAAFDRLLAFVANWRWQLGAPSEDRRTLDPKTVGRAFEQQTNQKQLGAYYTQEDISGYICRATIIPALFDKAQLPIAQLTLRRSIRRYLYPAMSSTATLPTETAYERTARLERTEEIIAAGRAGAIATINDAISANLNLEAMLLDLIARLRLRPLRRLAAALHALTVLDPTVGSGAFLLAAIELLLPIWQAVRTRLMELQPDDQLIPADDAAIIRTIIARNLYGVDISDEAVEACRLRLLLHMLAHDPQRRVGPLPDMSLSLPVGNALVGFYNRRHIYRRTGPIILPLILKRMREEQRAYRAALPDPASGKTRPPYPRALHKLAARTLDRELLRIGPIWKTAQGLSSQPLHWPVIFGDLLDENDSDWYAGFDVVIGNPPYVANGDVREQYRVWEAQTLRCGNLYAITVERSISLLREGGRCGMIVPIASVSTKRMAPLQAIYQPLVQWHSHYAVRPGKLFAGVDMNLTISLLQKIERADQRYVSGYRRWSSGADGDRPYLFTTLSYTRLPQLDEHASPLPKLGSTREVRLLCRMLKHGHKLREYLSNEGTTIYFHSGGRYWRKALPHKLSSHYKALTVRPEVAPVVLAILNSQLFYWYWISNSNCMDVVAREVLELPVFALEKADQARFTALTTELVRSYEAASSRRMRHGERIRGEEVNVDVAAAHPTIDAIDRELAALYGLTAEELEFVLTYDLKYRIREDTAYEASHTG